MAAFRKSRLSESRQGRLRSRSSSFNPASDEIGLVSVLDKAVFRVDAIIAVTNKQLQHGRKA
jgi:hypothetical protein